MTYEELMPGIRNFRPREVGRKKNPNGTWSRITEGEILIQTPSGMIPEDKWADLAFKAVIDNNDLPLLEAIEAHVKERCIWLKEAEIRPYSLECLLDGAYKAWAARGEFKYIGKELQDAAES